MSFQSERGATLLMVLGILAVCTVLTVQMMDAVNGLSKQQLALKTQQQAYWYAVGGEEYARRLSLEYHTKGMLTKKQLALDFPIDTGRLSVNIIPLQNCFNLNAFSSRVGQKQLNREVAEIKMSDAKKNKGFKPNDPNTPASSTVGAASSPTVTGGENAGAALPDIKGIELKRNQLRALLTSKQVSNQAAEKLIDRLIDWQDQDNKTEGFNGAENTYYTSQQPAQLTANQHLLSQTEILQFDALKDEELQSVLPLLCAFPGDNNLALNINQLTEKTAGLLTAVFSAKIDEEQAKQMIEQRPEKGYKNVEEFLRSPQLNGLKLTAFEKASLTTKNSYFRIDSRVAIDSTDFTLQSIIKVNPDKQVQVISRQYGVSS